MPPKRKALAEADANKDVAGPPAKKNAKAGSTLAKNAASAGKETTKDATAAGKKTTKNATAAGKKTTKNATAAGKETTKNATAAGKETTKNATAAGKKTTKNATAAGKETTKNAAAAGKQAAEPMASKPRRYKYSNAETLTGALPLDTQKVVWKGHDSEDEDEDEDEGEDEGNPKADDDLAKDSESANIMSYSVTREGLEKFEWMIMEQQKRDQDCHNMYIYNDFSGYGTTEMMENTLKEFNKSIFKKDISPFEKWAFVEGLATFLKLGDLMTWMMNDDSESMRTIATMFGTMLLTCFDMLSEHGLLAPDSPVPNISILSMFMIEFAEHTGCDLDIDWSPEVVRALDKAGVELKPRKESRVSQEKLDKLREKYEEKEAEEVEDGKNIYQLLAKKKGWEPDDDFELGERIWARWDWKKEYAEFKKDHPGGDHYNLEKMSAREKESYTFGTEANNKRMESMGV